MKNAGNTVFRRDFLKGLATVPFLGYFSFAFKDNIKKELNKYDKDSYKVLGVDRLEVTKDKLLPTDHSPFQEITLWGNWSWMERRAAVELSWIHAS